MSALPKILIILVIWFIYTIILFQGCSDTLCLGCGEEATTVVPPADAAAVSTYPLTFLWDDAQPITHEGYPEYRDSILAARDENELLEITGLYFEEEERPEGYDNMGFARAALVRELLSDEIDEDRVRLRARLVDERPGVRNQEFRSAIFEWVKEEQVAETVEELPDRVNIRFPYNSVQEEYDPEVEAYINRLVENINASGGRILLTGHADNSGTEDYNYDLGLRRAEEIKSVLIDKGVPENKIEVQSRGETQPIASNSTPEGRHENRRVEIRIIEDSSN